MLTLNTRWLDDDDALLATYLHEQLHWFVNTRPQRTRAALAELRTRYPTVPSAEAGGARDAFSTYLHLLVCALEYASLRELIGEQAARRTIAQFAHYRWVYDTILGEWDFFSNLLQRHHLASDESPPQTQTPGPPADQPPPVGLS